MFLRSSTLVLAVFALAVAGLARAASLQALYSFGPANSGDAATPQEGLALDSAGNLYGVSYAGGVGVGAVFELSPPAAGQTAWTESVLLSFSERGANDGAHPAGKLLVGPAGTLFGTTSGGGGPDNDQGGTVFELTPPALPGSAWTETVLHVFAGGKKDGSGPSGSLAMDASGALYGVTTAGALGPGILYELSPPTGGKTAWSETILYEFSSKGDHAFGPTSGPVIDAGGTLYIEVEPVNALHGGSAGAVLSFSPSGGTTTETTLEMFPTTGKQGYGPTGGLAMDSSGALYGATSGGGKNDDGVVFRLSPPTGGGQWTLSVLAGLTGAQGVSDPASGVALTPGGDIVAVSDGQKKATNGAVFQLTPDGGAPWPLAVLATFTKKSPTLGQSPTGNLVTDAAGNIYGVTQQGGANGNGVVFEIIP
jgi:uncharacterized repeat protein (TIGR03803 family)